MKTSSKNEKLNELFFFVAYFIYLITAFIHVSFYAIYIERIGKYLILFSSFLLILKELINSKINIKEVLGLLISIALSIIINIHTNGYLMFPILIFIYGARRIEFKKIASFTAIIGIIMMLVVICSSRLGIITDYISNVNGRERHYLGFRYALFPSLLLLNITLLLIFLDNKNKIAFNILLFLLNYIMFKYTDSRLSFYISVIAIFGSFLIKKFPNFMKDRKIINNAMIVSFILCAGISLFTIFSYTGTNSTINSIDKQLEYRISLGRSSLEKYPVNLFGNDVSYIGSGLGIDGSHAVGEYNYVDCLYLNIIEKYGIIYFVVYITLMTIALRNIKLKNQYLLLFIISLYAVIGMIDDLSIYLHYNTFLFVIGSVFIPQKIKSI